MLNNISDILNQVLVRGNVSTTSASDGLYTDTILNQWINDATRFATSYRKWPFTEGRVSTTYVSGTEEYTYPENFKSDSIRLLQVGGKRLDKRNFVDYQSYREDSSTGTKKIYSDFGRIYFINPNSGVSGTITVYGQFLPAQIDPSDKTTLTVFSNADEEGNEAIVEEILCYAKQREKLPQEAQYHHNRAIEILEGVWKRYQDEQFGYQTENRSIFKRFDVLDGAQQDEIFKRDQWF